MKLIHTSLAAACAVLLGSAALAQAPANDPTGKWTTTFGETELKATAKSGSEGVYELTGKYNFGKGTLKGELKDGVFTGYWTEPGGGPDCKTVRDGTKNWGRAVFTFRGESLDGRWQYCDAAPDQTWTGTKVG